jgi:molybdate transport system substrate-binding protein
MVGVIVVASALAAGLVSAQPSRGETVKIYAAAAVKTPLGHIIADYEKTSGNKVAAVYDTAGATAQKFRADPDAALLITTATLIRNAESAGSLKDGTTVFLGRTVAGIAVPPGTPKPDVSTPEKLKAALLAAKRVGFSDPARGATVGTHFAKMIETLGIKDEVMKKATLSPDGVQTMRLVLEQKVDIGVSQSSEIFQAHPDSMAGPFPQEFALATDFSLWHPNTMSPAARDIVNLLTGPAGREKLAAEGLLPPAAR